MNTPTRGITIAALAGLTTAATAQNIATVTLTASAATVLPGDTLSGVCTTRTEEGV